MRPPPSGPLDARRLGGVGVLAAAVLALAVGAGLGRPLVVGVASAPPVDPPPQVGECLFAGTRGPSESGGPDGGGGDTLDLRWYGKCEGAWLGEVVAVLSPADRQADRTASGDGPSVDPCTSAAADYLGRTAFDDRGVWLPVGTDAGSWEPDQRQSASGQNWRACVLGPPYWGPDGAPASYYPSAARQQTPESFRGRWSELDIRNRFGRCQKVRPVQEGHVVGDVFCGSGHDRETLAWTFWGTTGEGAATDVAALLRGCTEAAGRLVQNEDPTLDGSLDVQVVIDDFSGQQNVLTAASVLPEQGSANCAVSPADPAQQLTATVVGLGSAPPPLADR